MKYRNYTDHIKSPAALIRHLHSCVFLDGEMDLQGPLEEEVEVGEQEEREEVKDKHTVGDTDRPPEGVEMDFGVPQECYCGLKDLPRRVSALERSLYLSLPSWVHAALFFNFFGHVGKSSLPDLSLPMRLMSYLLLPYTLPAAAIFHLNYRFMCLAHWEKTNLLKWFRGVQEKDHWQRWNRTFTEKSHWLIWITGLQVNAHWPMWITGLQENAHWPMWITGHQEKAHWLWRDVRLVVRFLLRASVSSLKTVLPTRLPSLRFSSLRFPAVRLRSLQSILLPSLLSPSLCSVSFPALSLLLRILPLRCLSFGSAPQTEPVPARGTVLRHRRSVLRFHLSTTSSSSTSDSVDAASYAPSPPEPSRAVSFLFNLQLEVKEQPDLDIYPAPPLLPAPPELSSEEEVEDEGLCSPYISFLAVKEEDGRDEDSDVEDVWDSSSSRSSSDFSHQRAVSE